MVSKLIHGSSTGEVALTRSLSLSVDLTKWETNKGKDKAKRKWDGQIM